MNVRLTALAIVFVGSLSLTGVAIFQHGYIVVFGAGLRDSASMQAFFDLVRRGRGVRTRISS